MDIIKLILVIGSITILGSLACECLLSIYYGVKYGFTTTLPKKQDKNLRILNSLAIIAFIITTFTLVIAIISL